MIHGSAVGEGEETDVRGTECPRGSCHGGLPMPLLIGPVCLVSHDRFVRPLLDVRGKILDIIFMLSEKDSPKFPTHYIVTRFYD